MNRTEKFTKLASDVIWDLVVIGGGATGLGTALDASLRGYSVLLLESHDFAGGTSSRSTKLLHGGVRYLGQGNIGLVREALQERRAILDIAPHVTAPLAFVMPSYARWRMAFYGIGLKLYDLLAGDSRLGKTQWLSKTETERLLPGVQRDGLLGGVKYWDAQFDDARLALSIARSAELAGAVILNHTTVTALRPVTQATDIETDAKWTVAWTDQRRSERGVVRARCVVNATGVWVDEVTGMLPPRGEKPSRKMVTPSQGVHLVVERSFLKGDTALLVPKTEDGRVLFAIPWLGSLILGTTDTLRDDAPREPKAREEEIAFIFREAGKALSRSPSRADVRSVWVGLRPLVAPKKSKSTQKISREHTIELSAPAMLTVTGGKWTTYRSMAEDVLGEIQENKLLPLRGKCQTLAHRLSGSQGAQPHSLTDSPGLHLYGGLSAEVEKYDGASDDIGLGMTAAMVRYAVHQEFAMTVEDVLARRWRALFLNARAALQMAPRVAEIMRGENGLDPDLDPFVALCHHYLLDASAPAAD